MSTTTPKDLYRKNALPAIEQRKPGDRYLVKSDQDKLLWPLRFQA